MSHVSIDTRERITTVTLDRGKVNALNGDVVDELRDRFRYLEADAGTDAIILTGAGKFFSFGFDIPEFLSFSKEQFAGYLANFVDVYTHLFRFPKPVVAALNGHTIAGGCMLALACDHRVMSSGRGRIALNEISFGASVFAGSVEMLRFWIGSANATAVLCSGKLYSAEEAHGLGLVQETAGDGELMGLARRAAAELAAKPGPAFASIKRLLRAPVLSSIADREMASIRDFVDIWYSEATWANLQDIRIR